MPDNLQPTMIREFSLPDHDILAITGRDAAKFAHAQFMSDVAALAPGHWHWSGWLTPKGRVIAWRSHSFIVNIPHGRKKEQGP